VIKPREDELKISYWRSYKYLQMGFLCSQFHWTVIRHEVTSGHPWSSCCSCTGI